MSDVNLEELYELVIDAVREGIREEAGGGEARIHPRNLEGKVVFYDGAGVEFKEIPTAQLFRKVTSVREKLRVLEQKINNNGGLGTSDKAELQAYISRAYGSLTTFNFLFRDAEDRFRGTGK